MKKCENPKCDNLVDDSVYKNKIYCCKKCKHRNLSRINRKKPSTLKCYICAKCEKEFTSPHIKKFCSKECQLKAQTKYLVIADCLNNSDRKIDKNIGYVRIYVPMHPNANSRGYYYEHRVVMEHHLGRMLTKDEVVHHKNGIRWDNRIENLEVMDKREHSMLKGEIVPVNMDINDLADIVNKTPCLGVHKVYRKVNDAPKSKICECGNKKDVGAKQCVSCFKKRLRRFEVSKEELEKLVQELPLTKIGKMFGVTDNAIKRRCKILGIKLENRLGYWTKKRFGKI